MHKYLTNGVSFFLFFWKGGGEGEETWRATEVLDTWVENGAEDDHFVFAGFICLLCFVLAFGTLASGTAENKVERNKE